ncbi:response regulator [Kutzneria sp. NPDC052558]|uniref:response regulator n=1 Tax=Kutzneria sp. NPDC052558 TaxID=3364121 RepID=UPI0037CC7250
MIRVLLADDEALIRTGIRLVLAAAGDVEVVAECADGAEAVKLARRHQPDVALVDIRMPKLDGIATAREIQPPAIRTHVVMLSTFGEDANVARALRAGAVGFLLKDTPPDELIQAVRIAARGESILSPAITQRLISQFIAPEDDRVVAARRRLAVLTDKELDVLVQVGNGLSNGEIARSLHMSEGTAKAHISRILAKLQCVNRVQAAILAHDSGVLTAG